MWWYMKDLVGRTEGQAKAHVVRRRGETSFDDQQCELGKEGPKKF
jgi:hypothetical protein